MPSAAQAVAARLAPALEHARRLGAQAADDLAAGRRPRPCPWPAYTGSLCRYLLASAWADGCQAARRANSLHAGIR